jgi:four helix bundle protein
MFLQLNHQNLNVFVAAKDFTFECYRITNAFPPEERYILVQQIRRAALPVVLNIAEGSSRKPNIERKRFFEISRSSVIEIDAALDVANKLSYLNSNNCDELCELINKVFSMLSRLIQNT